ncbi:hypothetical protein WAI453_010805 [Rhynchosporium graminicola]
MVNLLFLTAAAALIRKLPMIRYWDRDLMATRHVQGEILGMRHMFTFEASAHLAFIRRPFYIHGQYVMGPSMSLSHGRRNKGTGFYTGEV